MKKIAVTQRVDEVIQYGEKRDAVDQRWTNYLLELNMFPIFVSNDLQYVKSLLTHENITGVLFTGGNSLQKYGGTAPERDAVEDILIEWAINNMIPVVGICRGMQKIQDYFGVALSKVDNHVGTSHKLHVYQGLAASELLQLGSVTVYHEYGTKDTVSELNIVARAEDGVVMAIEHSKYPFYGCMWHSERNQPFCPVDQQIFLKYFN